MVGSRVWAGPCLFLLRIIITIIIIIVIIIIIITIISRAGPRSFLPPVILVVMMVTMSKGSCSHDRDNCNDNRKEGTTNQQILEVDLFTSHHDHVYKELKSLLLLMISTQGAQYVPLSISAKLTTHITMKSSSNPRVGGRETTLSQALTQHKTHIHIHTDTHTRKV